MFFSTNTSEGQFQLLVLDCWRSNSLAHISHGGKWSETACPLLNARNWRDTGYTPPLHLILPASTFAHRLCQILVHNLLSATRVIVIFSDFVPKCQLTKCAKYSLDRTYNSHMWIGLMYFFRGWQTNNCININEVLIDSLRAFVEFFSAAQYNYRPFQIHILGLLFVTLQCRWVSSGICRAKTKPGVTS